MNCTSVSSTSVNCTKTTLGNYQLVPALEINISWLLNTSILIPFLSPVSNREKIHTDSSRTMIPGTGSNTVINLLISKIWTMNPVKSTRESWKKFGRCDTNLSCPTFISAMQLNTPFKRSNPISWKCYLALLRTFPKIVGYLTSTNGYESQSPVTLKNLNPLFMHGNILMLQVAKIMHP